VSLLVQRPDVSEFRKRFRWLTVVVLVLLLAVVGRMVQLQLLLGDEYAAIARENIVRKVTLATTRGIVRDRKGEVLSASRASYDMFVEPKRITVLDEKGQPKMGDVWRRLAELASLSDEERQRYEQRVLSIRGRGGAQSDQQIILMEDVSRDTVASLMTHARELPGIHVVPVSVRYYPRGSVGAHMLGYMREVDADMLADLRKQGYVEGDRVGASGLERAWESYLRGTRGWEKVLVDARGTRRPGHEEIIDEPKRIEPIPGRDLRLTVDARLQDAMVKAMHGELAGGAALIDVRTGRILGLVSKPSYDPNQLSGGFGKQTVRDAFRRLFNDPLTPALDKTVSGAYPPGSTVKPFTALAALEKGLIDQRRSSLCRGFLSFGKRIFRCTQSHGPTDFHKAIAQSCNVYFYRLVSEYGLTMDMIAEVAMRFGLGQKTGLGINAESSGRIPTRAWSTRRNKGQFRIGFTVNAGIGQGATTATVMQLGLAYAALANGGTLYQPQLVRAVETADGAVVQDLAPRVRRRIPLDSAHRQLIADALWGGVNEEGGTSSRARLVGLDAAGKTGTSQVSHRPTGNEDPENTWYFNRDHAWFTGYSPSKSPEVAICVLIEHGGSGGKHAAPVAFEILQAYHRIVDQDRQSEAKALGGRATP
jgi:penicillin-binding protein 2